MFPLLHSIRPVGRNSQITEESVVAGGCLAVVSDACGLMLTPIDNSGTTTSITITTTSRYSSVFLGFLLQGYPVNILVLRMENSVVES